MRYTEPEHTGEEVVYGRVFCSKPSRPPRNACRFTARGSRRDIEARRRLLSKVAAPELHNLSRDMR